MKRAALVTAVSFAVTCVAASVWAAVPITHRPTYVLQALSASLAAPPSSELFKPLAQQVPVPGFFDIDPGNNWARYVTAASQGRAYAIKTVSLKKVTPATSVCEEIFPAHTFLQLNKPNIRLHWPLMYEAPGTKWTLTILYGTPTAWDDDGPGPNPPGYVHTEIWAWQVDVTWESLATLLDLFHNVPFGLDEVPLISDEVLYPVLVQKLAAAKAAYAAGNKALAHLLLGEMAMIIQDACIPTSPPAPDPTGPSTGIAGTYENPACCKLLVDIMFLSDKYRL